jgi:hypothetical protein
LSGTPGQYSLITKSGQVYALAGDGSLLGDHVGQEVKITGSQSNGSASTPAATANTAAPGGAASGGTPYGSTGTTNSQPGAAAQSQTGSAANSPARPGTPSAASAASSGPKLQVSDVTKVGSFCNMAQPH